jgi:hypothetical protein
MFQRVKKSSNTVFQAAISKTDIFKFCYHGFLSFNSPNDIIFVFDMCPFHTFLSVSGLEGRKAHNYLITFYIIYQNYYK